MSEQEVQERRQGVEVDEGAAEFEALGLGTEETAALKLQGFVVGEPRGDRIIYKLRFRFQGRQRVRYLGTDSKKAARVEQFVESLQRGRCIKKQLRDLDREVTERFNAMKRRLGPFLNQAGLTFHGLAIRRPRGSRAKAMAPVDKQKGD